MAWNDFLRSASFRGIPFYVDSSTAQFGRKTIEHEFPGKDISTMEDQGKATPRFSIEAFVVGDTYKFLKDALISACEKEGAGTLIHPYYGKKKVYVNGVISVSESTQNGGMASISISFSEAEKPMFPLSVLNTIVSLVAKIAVAFEALKSKFNDVFNLFQQPSAIIEAVQGAMSEAISMIDSAFTSIKQIDGFGVSLNNLRALMEASSSALQPSASEISEAVVEIFSYGETTESVTEKLELIDFKKDDGVIEANEKAFLEMIQEAAIIGAVQSVPNITFTNTQESENMISQLNNAFEDIMNRADDVMYYELHDLQAAVVEDIEQRSINLPDVLTIQIPKALPSLFIAYDRYEDIDRAEEIVKKNHIKHPGFVPGLVDLEVLSE